MNGASGLLPSDDVNTFEKSRNEWTKILEEQGGKKQRRIDDRSRNSCFQEIQWFPFWFKWKSRKFFSLLNFFDNFLSKFDNYQVNKNINSFCAFWVRVFFIKIMIQNFNIFQKKLQQNLNLVEVSKFVSDFKKVKVSIFRKIFIFSKLSLFWE